MVHLLNMQPNDSVLRLLLVLVFMVFILFELFVVADTAAQRPASAAGASRHWAPNWEWTKRLAPLGCMLLFGIGVFIQI